MSGPLEFVAAVIAALEKAGIPYHVGGSMASSVHGMFRASADVDFVIDPDAPRLEALGDALEPEFYVNRPAMKEALQHRGTFNAVHPETSFKIDFFVAGRGGFDTEEMRRAVLVDVPGRPPLRVYVKSPEDTVLRKLDWYRRGGEVSERQWEDAVGVLATLGDRLDGAYLDQWAASLGVSDLLKRARTAAAER